MTTKFSLEAQADAFYTQERSVTNLVKQIRNNIFYVVKTLAGPSPFFDEE